MEETGPFRDAMIIFIGLKLGKKSGTAVRTQPPKDCLGSYIGLVMLTDITRPFAGDLEACMRRCRQSYIIHSTTVLYIYSSTIHIYIHTKVGG